ncbi:MAG: DUF2796 domain-containing protein [Rubrivivax sp.]|jgi:hypothetical protein
MKLLPTLSLLAALCVAGPAWAGKAHEHGTAKLDLAVDAAKLVVSLELPMDTLVGFERAPRTDAEKASLQQALARLEKADDWLRPDSAGQCTRGATSVNPPVFGQGEHADVDVSVEFTCKDTARIAFVEVALYGTLPRLQRVDVQAVTRKGQMKATLKKPVTRVSLAR